MPLPHSTNTSTCHFKPKQAPHSSKIPRAPGWGRQHSLLGTGRRPARLPVSRLHTPAFPITSPLTPVRTLSFHFPFKVSNLTSPLSAFRLLLQGSPFLPPSILQPYSRSTDYSLYFCSQQGIRDSAKRKAHGKSDLRLSPSSEHPLLQAPTSPFQVFKALGAGGCAPGIPKVIKKVALSILLLTYLHTV